MKKYVYKLEAFATSEGQYSLFTDELDKAQPRHEVNRIAEQIRDDMWKEVAYMAEPLSHEAPGRLNPFIMSMFLDDEYPAGGLEIGITVEFPYKVLGGFHRLHLWYVRLALVSGRWVIELRNEAKRPLYNGRNVNLTHYLTDTVPYYLAKSYRNAARYVKERDEERARALILQDAPYMEMLGVNLNTARSHVLGSRVEAGIARYRGQATGDINIQLRLRAELYPVIMRSVHTITAELAAAEFLAAAGTGGKKA